MKWTKIKAGHYQREDGVSILDYLARALVGDIQIRAPHGRITSPPPEHDGCPLTAVEMILAIAMAEPEAKDRFEAQNTTGGGLLVLHPDGRVEIP